MFRGKESGWREGWRASWWGGGEPGDGAVRRSVRGEVKSEDRGGLERTQWRDEGGREKAKGRLGR